MMMAPPPDYQLSTISSQRKRSAFTLVEQRERGSAFTLVELLIVVGIIGLLVVLIAPAFTSIKSGDDVTDAAYTIKGALDTARTYAKANNTYTWVNFTGSMGTNVTGQVRAAIAASTYGIANPYFVTTVGKTVTLNNIHIGDPGARQNNQSEFETRPACDVGYQVGVNSPTPCIQFNPRGEAQLYGNGMSPTIEIALLPTHGNSLAVSPGNGQVLLGNIAAIQVSGFGGNVKIYRR
jgi:type II secretory pathway pseudopilin PulG